MVEHLAPIIRERNRNITRPDTEAEPSKNDWELYRVSSKNLPSF